MPSRKGHSAASNLAPTGKRSPPISYDQSDHFSNDKSSNYFETLWPPWQKAPSNIPWMVSRKLDIYLLLGTLAPTWQPFRLCVYPWCEDVKTFIKCPSVTLAWSLFLARARAEDKTVHFEWIHVMPWSLCKAKIRMPWDDVHILTKQKKSTAITWFWHLVSN